MPAAPSSSEESELRARVPAVMLRDRERLERRIDGATRERDPERRASAVERLTQEFDAAEQRVARRRSAVPKIEYPAELPIVERREDLLEAIEKHQVVIVAGETARARARNFPSCVWNPAVVCWA